MSMRVTISVLLLAAAFASQPTAQDAKACTVAELQSRAPRDTTIASATMIEASGTMPAHCLVDGAVTTPGNTVSFRLGLPAAWNNKFYFEGVGGFAGAIGPLRSGLERGYAAASTDTGHQGTFVDASWARNNPAKRVDYASRGTHVTAVAAKALVGAYYGGAPRHAYFNGCSNGGRQGLMEAQRYPEDFDGIIAGDPALGTLGHVRRTVSYQKMLASADRYLPPSKVKVLAQATLSSCDASDGLKDGLISDPRACTFRPETLKCSGADGPDCLTEAQVETVKDIYADAPGPGGTVLPGFPAGHEDGSTGWQQWITGTTPVVLANDGTLAFAGNPPLGFRFQDGFLRHLAFETDSNFDWRTFSIERHGPQLMADAATFSPTDTNLSALQRRGGKLLLYHGWADPGLSPFGTLRYYEGVVRAAGGPDRSEEFVKLFMVPGMHHCPGNGPGPNTFDMLTALENWVERGAAPTSVVASHAINGAVDRTRPLCAYPMVARYRGTGSVDAAENFRCESP
jgi:feruloyl esterase